RRGDGDLADHDRDGADLHVAVEQGVDARVARRLAAHELGDGVAHGPVEFADDDLRLGGGPIRPGLDERLAGAQHDTASGFGCLLLEGLLLGHGQASLDELSRADRIILATEWLAGRQAVETLEGGLTMSTEAVSRPVLVLRGTHGESRQPAP